MPPRVRSKHVRDARRRRCRLKTIRKEYQDRRKVRGKAVTVEDIAFSLDISTGGYTSYEKGHMPTALICNDICALFKTTVLDIYPREGVKHVQ